MDPQTDGEQSPPRLDAAARERFERRRAQAERSTSDALRRIPLVIATAVLLALALWWLQKG